MKRFFAAALVVTFTACSGDLPHESPFDPATPLTKQARATVSGMVALEGETDYGQVTFELQNAERTYTGSSRSDGSFDVTGVVPGKYGVRFTARYFEEVEGEITVGLGAAEDVGLRTLRLKRAAVEGKASAIRNTGTVGGLVVTLTKAASIRGAGAAAAPAGWWPFADGADAKESHTVVSGGDGAFRIEDVPAGVYDVYVGSAVVAKVTITGEQAVVTLEPVTLDESGPAVPNLVVGDIDGDGFALDATTVELTWTRPSEADLDHFDLERYVVGVDAGFQAYRTLGKSAASLRDDVSATTGRRHLYRIRSVDEIGNASDWSVVAEAEPFAALDAINWVRGGDGVHYFFPVQKGTNSLSAVYAYSDTARSRYTAALANNVPDWLRPAVAGNWEESLMLRTANQANTLAYESDFSLDLNRRSIVAHDNTGAYLGYGCGVAVNSSGKAIALYSDGAYGGMWVGEEEAGGWRNTRIDDDWDTSFYAQVFSVGDTHRAVYAIGNAVRYASDATGAWSRADVVTGVDVRGLSAAVDGAGRIHVAALVNNSGVNMTVRYYRVTDGAVDLTEDIETISYMSDAVGIGVAADGRLHVTYYSAASADLRYATRAPAGGWTLTSPDTAGSVGRYSSLFVDQSGGLHVAYIVANDGAGTLNKVRYLYKPSGGGWAAAELVDAAINASQYTAVAVTPEGDRYVFFTDNSQSRLYMARRTASGTWSTTQVETPINQYYGHSLRAVVDNRHRVHVVYMHNDERDVRHLVVSSGGLAQEQIGYGWAYRVDFKARGSGELHVLYGDNWSSVLYRHTNRSGVWVRDTVATGTQWGKLDVGPDGVLHAVYANPNLRYATESGGSWPSEAIPGGSSLYDYTPVYGGAVTAVAWVTSTNPSHVYYSAREGAWSAPEDVAQVASPASFRYVRATSAGGAVYVAATQIAYPYSTTSLFRRDAAGWSPVAFAPPVTDIVVQDLAADAQGALHMVYYDAVDLDLLYATNRGGTWTHRRIDTEGDTGYNARVYVDDRGFVHIAFLSSGSDFSYATNVGGWHVAKIVDAPFGVSNAAFSADDDGALHAVWIDSTWVNVLPFFGGRLGATSVQRISGW